MEQKKVIIVLALVFIIGASLAAISYSFWAVEGIRAYNMSIIVDDHIGFDTDNTTLSFGMVVPGAASSIRYIHLKNSNDHPVTAEFRCSGEMAEWVSLHGKERVLAPQEEAKVPVMAAAPKNTGFGNYTGLMRITFKRDILG